ncbi:12556_t:CDS:2, partial [Racocetra fulgida]
PDTSSTNQTNTEEITLQNGKFIRNCQIPSDLLRNCRDIEQDEFKFMRYTACTSNPDDFMDNGFTLRQAEYHRETELFIVVTMYDEDVDELARTFHGIAENIASLCARGSTYLTVLGVYQEGIAIKSIDDVKVKAHIFEYTTQISINQDLNMKTADERIVPIQVLFCHKEKNAKKINSHRWFFNAFSPILQPKICILIDTHLNVAGICGEIVAMTSWSKLLNPIVAAQYFEYKMSNILDKPLESVFGYITVLPGAFSAYRYIALQNEKVDGKLEGPLASYFMGEKDDNDESNKDGNDERRNEEIINNEKSTNNIFTANMYLAEDRILTFELVTKRDSEWLLHYVKSSQAETDIPKSIDKLISQRRQADDDNELKQVTTHGNDSLQFTPIDTADGYEKAKNALGHRKENK